VQGALRQCFRFGIFELDRNSCELRQDGKLKPRLREQTLQVLLTLLERPQEVVTRQELRKRLWPSDTFVDFDHSLNTGINELRTALGDSATNPRFIQTIPRRGYRFIAPVVVVMNGIGVAPVSPVDRKAGPAHEQRVPIRDPEGESCNQEDGIPQPARPTILSDPSELPTAPSDTVRLLFSLIQAMYLSFYVVSLARLPKVEAILMEWRNLQRIILLVLLVTAAVGIPIRLYLLAASAFNYRAIAEKFQKLFPFLFVLDELWALAPFLIVGFIGAGSAIAATAALAYLPFAQRSLLLMGSSAQLK
jgi:cholera toxin transcriptional activator